MGWASETVATADHLRVALAAAENHALDVSLARSLNDLPARVFRHLDDGEDLTSYDEFLAPKRDLEALRSLVRKALAVPR